MGLFATMPVHQVTVQDIAAAVDVTPAAVYYHFSSKEQILSEGMHQFRDRLLDFVRERRSTYAEQGSVGPLVRDLLGWVGRHRDEALVFYVTSSGLNLMVEALRRETRVELVEVLRTAVRTEPGRASAAEAGVVAVALVSLVETSVASMLNQDAAFRGIGARHYAGEVAAIADALVGAHA